LRRLATIHPLRTDDRQTTTVTTARPLLIRSAKNDDFNRLSFITFWVERVFRMHQIPQVMVTAHSPMLSRVT